MANLSIKTWMGALLAAGLVSGGVWVTVDGSLKAGSTASELAPRDISGVTPLAQVDTAEHPRVKSFPTATMFSDTFRATHIVRGIVTAVTFPSADVTMTVQPLEYIKGTPLQQVTVDLVTGFNGDLRQHVGRECVAAFIVRDDGVSGLCHGLMSFTAADWGISTTLSFYRGILAISTEGGEAVQIAADEHPADGRYGYPEWVKQQYVDQLVTTLGESGTHAAWQAGNELAQNPTFASGVLSAGHLARIAQNAVRSMPGSKDRGYDYILLDRNNSSALALNATESLIADETKNINLDHLSGYLSKTQPEESVVQVLETILTHPLTPKNQNGYTDTVRANAMVVAGQIGSRKILPTLHRLLGHETNRRCKVELLDALRNLHDPSNFKPLANYLNGGDAENLHNVQRDHLDSVNLHKRTLVAIAAIDSVESNQLIQDAFDGCRAIELKHFLKPLLEVNKQWRSVVTMLPSEGDVSFYELDKRYQEMGIIEPHN